MSLNTVRNITIYGKNVTRKYLPFIYQEIKFLYQTVLSHLYSNNLYTLAHIFRTDKLGDHDYIEKYVSHFSPLKNKRNTILEIGIGGYSSQLAGGNSLRMWKHYFKNSHIYGIDVHDKSHVQERRITIFQGSQDDEKFLRRVVGSIGVIDIVIDDGSHINGHVIDTFKLLFPSLSENGMYVIEDTQTSYWPKFGGDSYDLNSSKTTVGYFKNLIDGLNHSEIARIGYVSSYLDCNIKSIHFYHNQIFIYKGKNNFRSKYSDRYLY